jgi:hypothetical protein
MPRSTNVTVAARTAVSSIGTFVEPSHELPGFGLIVAGLAQGIPPGRQVVPAGAAGRFRMRGDHRDIRLHKITPILDPFRILFPHQEHDGRGIGGALIRKARLPIGTDQAGLGDGVDVVRQRERHDVCIQAVDDRPRLLPRSAVRLVHSQAFACAFQPLLGERRVDLLK